MEKKLLAVYVVWISFYCLPQWANGQDKPNLIKTQKNAQLEESLIFGSWEATISSKADSGLRTYVLKSTAPLRDNLPSEKRVEFSEKKAHSYIRTGNLMFDGIYAMAVDEAVQNSVAEINNWNYASGSHLMFEAFQTGEKWTYVWTRDLAYSVDLALAGFEPKRSVSSLLFKTSELKDSVGEKGHGQIIQDTGSGGSYPVSTDRVVWALGAWEVMKYLNDEERASFLNKIYPILCNTIEQDRKLVYDNSDGLYRGEQSFLDWREQTYPQWTKKNVLPIALSKALSVNVLYYGLLKITSECAGLQKNEKDAARYNHWAKELKKAINLHFYDRESGLYSTYLISDGLNNICVKRFDLLGNALAILLEVADKKRAERVLANYPIGLHGPAVVWPQERNVPIYHNQGIWPFVTAYWIKAASKQNNASAVNQGVLTMHRLAALNLSNMENYDFVSGKAEVDGQTLNGPVVNSRRQLWSVAGYMSMVQSVLFGQQTSLEGIRFAPYITAKLHQELFAETNTLEFKNIDYLGKQNSVRVYLPPFNSGTVGAYKIQKVLFNGQIVGSEYISDKRMKATNQWDIYLQVAQEESRKMTQVNMVDVKNERLLYGPAMPEWDTSKDGGVAVEGDCLNLYFTHPDTSDVTFNIYRDGELVATHLKQTKWMDKSSVNYASVAYGYAVEAVDRETGTVSHLSPINRYFNSKKTYTISANAMKNRGGTLISNHHFGDWGKSDHELHAEFMVDSNGHYLITSEFANGSGPVNTGITCAVKKLDVRDVEAGKVVASGYLIMPQSGNWKRWDISSPVTANLKSGKMYELIIYEDEYALNMSYFEQNKWYKKNGGGDAAYNYVDIASVQINLLKVTSPSSKKNDYKK